jgi:HNH endonuclease
MKLHQTVRANGVWQGHHWIRDDKRLAIWLRDGLKCVYCQSTAVPTDACVEHVHAFERGGSNHQSNLVTSCQRCNSRKGDLPLRRFARRIGGDVEGMDEIVARVARFTSRQLRPYRIKAKQLIARHGTAARALSAIA